jgi:protein-S-isoprenylcysteine O-methyltransferase Ste14
VLAFGFGLFAWCVADFITAGRGTPDPGRPPRNLVVRGPFRLVRNPMYVGVLTMIAGESMLFASPWLAAWAAIMFVTFHVRVIAYEEPTLGRTFGPSWESYCARVPRWLPRLRPR